MFHLMLCIIVISTNRFQSNAKMIKKCMFFLYKKKASPVLDTNLKGRNLCVFFVVCKTPEEIKSSFYFTIYKIKSKSTCIYSHCLSLFYIYDRSFFFMYFQSKAAWNHIASSWQFTKYAVMIWFIVICYKIFALCEWTSTNSFGEEKRLFLIFDSVLSFDSIKC